MIHCKNCKFFKSIKYGSHECDSIPYHSATMYAHSYTWLDCCWYERKWYKFWIKK